MSSRISGRIVVPTDSDVPRASGLEDHAVRNRRIVGNYIRSLSKKDRSELDENERTGLTEPRTGAAIPAERAVFAVHADRHHESRGISAYVWDAGTVRDEIRDRTFFASKPPVDPKTPHGGMLEFPKSARRGNTPIPVPYDNAYDDSHDFFKFLDADGRRIPGSELAAVTRAVARMMENGRIGKIRARPGSHTASGPSTPAGPPADAEDDEDDEVEGEDEDKGRRPTSTAGKRVSPGDAFSLGVYDLASRHDPYGSGDPPKILVRYHRVVPSGGLARSEIRVLVVYITDRSAFDPKRVAEAPLSSTELPGCRRVAFMDSYLVRRELHVRWYWNEDYGAKLRLDLQYHRYELSNLESDEEGGKDSDDEKDTDEEKETDDEEIADERRYGIRFNIEGLERRIRAAREIGRVMVRGTIDALVQHGDVHGNLDEYLVTLESTPQSVTYYDQIFRMAEDPDPGVPKQYWNTTFMRGRLDRLDRAALVVRRDPGWEAGADGTIRGVYREVGPHMDSRRLANPKPRRLRDRRGPGPRRALAERFAELAASRRTPALKRLAETLRERSAKRPAPAA